MIHPETNEFYIGRRTSDKPANEDSKYRGSSVSWYRELSKDIIENVLIKEIVNENIYSKEELNILEIEEISKNIKNPLCRNAHIPGIGYYTPGPRSEETKRKLSEHFTGKPNPNYPKKLSEEAKKNISEGCKGRKISEVTKKKLSMSGSKRKLTEEHKANLSKAWETRRENGVSDETKKKLSEAASNRTPEHKEKIANSQRGKIKPIKEETKKKLSESLKGKEFSEEHKQKLRKPKSTKGKKLSEETKLKRAESRKRNKESKDQNES